MMRGLTGVILAGGAASRFNGLMKPRLIIGGKTILSRILEEISGLFSAMMIVTNNPESFSDVSGCRLIRDEILNSGPLGGIHAAMKAAKTEAIFVIAGDMPFPDPQIILSMSDVYNSGKCDAVIPERCGMIEPLHAIYSVSLLPALESYLAEGGNRAVRGFIKDLNTCHLELEDTESVRRAFMNINSPSDLRFDVGGDHD